jgi:hypothetical protein
MISGVTRQIAGKSETFRMTTRAMMAIEDRFDKGLIEVLQGLETGFRISDIVTLVSECADDGAGVDVGRASQLVDEIGVTEAGNLLGEVAEGAFPEAKKGKNSKRAVPPKK